ENDAAAAETGALTDRSWPAELAVEAADDRVEVDTGALRFGLTLGEGATLRFVEHDGKRIVSDNAAPLVSAQVMESAAYDQLTDYVADAAFRDGEYEVTDVEYDHEGNLFTARLTGRLSFGDDAILFTLELSAEGGEPHLHTAVELEPEGDFDGRYIRQVNVALPLDLHWRKRVAQGGDRGMSWDTRYYYEFLRDLPRDPDRNEWRHFAVEQASPAYFRIWRSESQATAPVMHQHGVEAPGWSSVYDRDGGVLFGYRDMAGRAPKTVWVQAAGGAEARVYLHPPTERAFDVRNEAAAEAVFGEPHAIDWVFYRGEHPEARPEDWLADLWDADQPFAGRRPRSFSELEEGLPELLDADASGEASSPYVRGGIPFARGALSTEDEVRLWREDRELPVQHRPLAYWPDGSVKWLLLVFPLETGTEAEPPDAAAHEFEVSRRTGEPVSLTLYHGSELQPKAPARTVEVGERDEEVTVDTGPLQVRLATGEHWLREAVYEDRDMLRDPNDAALGFVDFLRTEDTYPVAATHPSGELDEGALHIDHIEVEEAGPLRAVVFMEGFAGGEEPARVELRLTFHAGRPWIRLLHTVEFRHEDPREAFVSGMGLNLPLDLELDSARITAGAQDGPAEFEPRAYNALHQLSPGHYRLTRSGEHGPETLDEQRRSRGWLDVSGEDGGVTLVLRDMWQDAPKEIAYWPEEGVLSAGLWPASGPVMDARRYSEYPHWAQGESVGPSNDWVEETFYPGGPLVGVARTHEMAIVFHDGSPSAQEKDAVAADFQRPPLVYSGFERYQDTGISIALPDYGAFPRMAENYTNFTNFWLFHQELHNWYGMWDYGDIQHRFRSGGYGDFADPDHLKDVLSLPEDEQSLDSAHMSTDFIAQQDWHFDNGRWGWTNTEGLPGLYLLNEYFRTGRRDVFFAAEALARHSRDVVTRHHGPRFGRGTRHGVQHWSDGNHEERQTIVSELRFHHYLTGEARSRDVMRRLAEESYAQGRVSRHADHSARLYGLFTYWEMTGGAEAGETMRDYVHGLIVPEGIGASADIRFSDGEVEVVDAEREVNYAGMFFHTFGAMHGLLEYYYVTEDPELRDALIRMADDLLERDAVRMINNAKVIAFAAAHGHEGAQEYLDDWMQGSSGFGYAYNIVSAHPARWSGALARMHGNQPIVMFVMNAMPLVMVALEEEPPLTESREETLEEDRALSGDERETLDEGDRRGFRDKPRLRWQHEYDDEELLDYFGPWRPPEAGSRQP
ncbi:MAG: hypothetical protein ACLFU6_13890, partial [Candidatus Hydrogenedentota bacterium]